MKAIVPFKKEGAKSRLGLFLSEREREELALNMLKDVLAALSKSKIDDIAIIATGSCEDIVNDAQVKDFTVMVSVSVREDKRELNEVLNEVIRAEKEPVLIVMADVPLTTPENINELIEHEEEVVIVPGRKGGTNALFLRRPFDFFVSYYGMSFLEHIDIAQRRSLTYAVYDSFFIGTDVDEEEDLIELLIHGKGFSAEYLRRIGILLRVNKKAKIGVRLERERSS